MSFDPPLLEAINPKLLRDRRTLAISRDMATCMEINLSFKTKAKLRTHMQHTQGTVGKDCEIFTRRRGDSLPELRKK